MVYKVPGLAEQVQVILNWIVKNVDGPDTPVLVENAGPVVLAFFVTVVLPRMPVLSTAERAIRRSLYELALIPAQQLSERNRLKKAPYMVEPEVLEAVRKKLEAEGFDRANLAYEATPSVRSMWTKTSLLMAHLAR